MSHSQSTTRSIADVEGAMRRALDLAARGPVTGGNPQVGCVLLYPDGRIAAEGFHHGAGTDHAEITALKNLNAVDAAGLTAVVSLEPCNHTGRTGPCSLALITAGITEVFFAVADPDPLAAHGSTRLREAGIAVTGGVLEAQATELLRPWLIATTHRRPYVTVKWASTLDGRTAAADGSSRWITGTTARQRVHEQREANDAILVGTGTVFADNPSLTARGDAGEWMEHQPIPVIIGERAIPTDARVTEHPAGIIETRSRDLPAILHDLFERGIRRAYVEGGPTLASALIAAELVDEYAIYLAPALLGGDHLAVGDLGIPTISDAKRLQITGVELLGNDLLVRALPLAASTVRPLQTPPQTTTQR